MSWTTREKNILGSSIAIICAVVLLAALLSYSLTIHSSGTVTAVGLGIYWNAAATQNVTSLPWGNVWPGSVYSVTVFAKNIRNSNVTLSMNTSNWSPSTATKYLAFSWNYTNGHVMLPGQIIPVAFQLAIASNMTGIVNFSFDIIVIATSTS